jgi:RNA polymerase primary sigma factor
MPEKKNFGDVPTMFSLDNKNKVQNKQMDSGLKIESEFNEPFNTWRTTQTPQNNDFMIQKLRPVIDSAIKSYAGQDAPPSVRLKANRMALEALKNYDPSKAKLKTHLMWHMQGLKRVATKANQILTVPERVQIDSGHINTAFNELTDKLGRDPSDSELADYTGLSVKRIAKVRSFKPGISEGAAAESIYAADDENVNDPASMIPGMESGKAWRNFVYDSLDTRAKLIMEHTFGLNNKPVIDNMSLARKLRITPARVSQIRAEIQKKLDSRERLGVL